MGQGILYLLWTDWDWEGSGLLCRHHEAPLVSTGRDIPSACLMKRRLSLYYCRALGNITGRRICLTAFNPMCNAAA